MQDWLAQRAQSTPEKLALVFEERYWSYAELDVWASKLTAHLQEASVQPGQRVGTYLPNQPIFIACIHALARLGAVQVPINTRLTQADLVQQLDRTDCNVLITSPEKRPALGEDAERKIAIIELDNRSEDDLPLCGYVPVQFDIENDQGIFFTSGTTGTPKGARLTFRNHFWSASASAYRLGVLPHDRWLLCMPLYHVGGHAIVLRSCLYGTAIELHDGFDPDGVYQSMMSGQITQVSLVPTMLYRMMEQIDDVGFPSPLRIILLGGAQASDELIAGTLKRNMPIALTYGLTEASSQVATASPEDVRRKPGSVGKPLLFTNLSILNDKGQLLGPGEIGEITISGPTIMKGYEGQSNGIDEFRTGDLGYLDGDGDLWVVNRRSDLVVSGGENIYPAEIEAAIQKHPAVQAACVVGLTDVEWGQTVAAAVVAADLKEHALFRFLRSLLAGYKLPRAVIFVKEIPLTPSGKVDRNAVRAMIEKEMMVTT